MFHPIWSRKAVPHLEPNLAVGMKGLYRYTSKTKTEEYVDQWNNEAGNLLTKGMEDQGTLCFFSSKSLVKIKQPSGIPGLFNC